MTFWEVVMLIILLPVILLIMWLALALVAQILRAVYIFCETLYEAIFG